MRVENLVISGQLYIVATPIGNLADISPRALAILTDVDLIAAEDTRHSRHLLQHYGINTPLQALHSHNEEKSAQQLLSKLQAGKSIALVSDAGTPLISDPGARLTRLAHQANIPVVAIPGASALIAALSVAGFSADQFYFAGFLPAKTQQRQKSLQALGKRPETAAFYEAPHRILACIEDAIEVIGAEREAALVKEISKCHETVYRATLAEIKAWLLDDPLRQKGEFVIIISAAETKKQDLDSDTQHLMQVLSKNLPLKQASQLGSEISGFNKKILYQYGLSLKDAD